MAKNGVLIKMMQEDDDLLAGDDANMINTPGAARLMTDSDDDGAVAAEGTRKQNTKDVDDHEMIITIDDAGVLKLMPMLPAVDHCSEQMKTRWWKIRDFRDCPGNRDAARPRTTRTGTNLASGALANCFLSQWGTSIAFPSTLSASCCRLPRVERLKQRADVS